VITPGFTCENTVDGRHFAPIGGLTGLDAVPGSTPRFRYALLPGRAHPGQMGVTRRAHRASFTRTDKSGGDQGGFALLQADRAAESNRHGEAIETQAVPGRVAGDDPNRPSRSGPGRGGRSRGGRCHWVRDWSRCGRACAVLTPVGQLCSHAYSHPARPMDPVLPGKRSPNPQPMIG
jgi:hypothetical protein